MTIIAIDGLLVPEKVGLTILDAALNSLVEGLDRLAGRLLTDPGVNPCTRLFEDFIREFGIVDRPGEDHGSYHRRPASDCRAASVCDIQLRERFTETVDLRS